MKIKIVTTDVRQNVGQSSKHRSECKGPEFPRTVFDHFEHPQQRRELVQRQPKAQTDRQTDRQTDKWSLWKWKNKFGIHTKIFHHNKCNYAMHIRPFNAQKNTTSQENKNMTSTNFYRWKLEECGCNSMRKFNAYCVVQHKCSHTQMNGLNVFTATTNLKYRKLVTLIQRVEKCITIMVEQHAQYHFNT